MKSEHIEWTVKDIAMIRLGGMWAVPRSGLIFRKDGDKLLTLTFRVPVPDRLSDEQQKDFELIKRHCEAGGITVKDESVNGN